MRTKKNYSNEELKQLGEIATLPNGQRAAAIKLFYRNSNKTRSEDAITQRVNKLVKQVGKTDFKNENKLSDLIPVIPKQNSNKLLDIMLFLASEKQTEALVKLIEHEF